MLKKMLVVSVATAGLACGAAFAGGPVSTPMAMSGPWGMTVDFGILYNNNNDGSNYLQAVPVTGSVTFIDFADMFRVDAGIGYQLAYTRNVGGIDIKHRSVYAFNVNYEMLHPWGSQSWLTYGLGAKVYGHGDTENKQKIAGFNLAEHNDSQVNFNVSANVGFMRALTNHSLVNFVVPVISYAYNGQTEISEQVTGQPAPLKVVEKAYSSFRFFDGFTIGYTYLF